MLPEPPASSYTHTRSRSRSHCTRAHPKNSRIPLAFRTIKLAKLERGYLATESKCEEDKVGSIVGSSEYRVSQRYLLCRYQRNISQRRLCLTYSMHYTWIICSNTIWQLKGSIRDAPKIITFRRFFPSSNRTLPTKIPSCPKVGYYIHRKFDRLYNSLELVVSNSRETYDTLPLLTAPPHFIILRRNEIMTRQIWRFVASKACIPQVYL